MPDTTQDDLTDITSMPDNVHGEKVMSAFRHVPAYGRRDYTYTVITRNDEVNADGMQLYTVFRARFAPVLRRWAVDTDYDVCSDLTWNRATNAFARFVTRSVARP